MHALTEAALRAVADHHFEPLLRTVARALGRDCAVLASYRHFDTCPRRLVTHGIDDAPREAFAQQAHRHNLWFQARSQLCPDHTVSLASELVPLSVLERSAWHRDFLAPQGIADALSLHCPGSGGHHACLSVLRQVDDAPFTEAERSRLTEAAAALRCAIGLYLQRCDLDLDTRFLRDASASRQMAHLLVDRVGRVITLTREAEHLLDHGDGLTGHDERLRFDNPDAANLFYLLLHQTMAALRGEASPAQPMRLPRPSGERPYVIDLCPWAVEGKHGQLDEHYALVTVFVLDEPLGVREELISTGYQLTPSESRLAAHLTDGLSLAQIGRRQGQTLATVRNHLKSVFNKTGIRRQGALVSELSRFLGE